MAVTRLSASGDAKTNNNNSKSMDKKATSTKATTTTFDHKMLAIMFVALVIDLLAFTMILPLLPALLDHYGQNEQVRAGAWSRCVCLEQSRECL